jgi:hypothetical protein
MGLLLGVSILQVPDLLLRFIGLLKEFYVNKYGRRINTLTENTIPEKGKTRSKLVLSPKKSNITFQIVNERSTLDRRKQNDVNNFLGDVLDVLE